MCLLLTIKSIFRLDIDIATLDNAIYCRTIFYDNVCSFDNL